jgi:predicted dehydrogenase
VLADKPWVLTAADLPRLETVLDTADAHGLIAYDIMTERFEITSILQRALVNDPDVFGAPLGGNEQEPAVFMESVHYLSKTVAGVPLRRPPWFFDIHQQGEGLTDVGTHLVDLVAWILFPEQPLDYRQDLRILAGKRWPTVLTRADFQNVTGETDFPEYLAPNLRGDCLEYYCNNSVSYAIRGIHVRLNVLWDFEAAAGAGDTHRAIFRGRRSRIEIHQGPEQKYQPELYVVPNTPADQGSVLAALRSRLQALQVKYPGVTVELAQLPWRVAVPDRYRIGHEAHFAEVTRQFLSYLQEPHKLPAWEKPNLLAKYYVTTQGVEVGRQSS